MRIRRRVLPRSSAVEQLTVNQWVAGSSPAEGSHFYINMELFGDDGVL